jgi:Skp family chaperone for outer membrane proteins
MMKHVLLSILILTGISAQSQSVKFAYINTKDILEKVPAFAEAQRSLDELSEKWKKYS